MRTLARARAAALGLTLAALAVAPAAPPPPTPPPTATPPLPAPAAALTPPGAARPEAGPGSPALEPLARARVQAVRRAYDEAWLFYRESRTDSVLVYLWSRFLLEAEQDAARTPAERVAAAEAHRARMLPMVSLVKKVGRLGMTRSAEVKAVDFYLAEADYWVARARARAQARPDGRGGGGAVDALD